MPKSNFLMAGLVLLAIGVLAGCTQTRFGNPYSSPPGLPPTPTGVVETGELEPTVPPPPGDENSLIAGENNELKPGIDPDTQVATLEPPADGGQDVTREALIGAWQVETSGIRCQIFLALTKWSGGYRAASRGCAAAALADVQAWDVKGKQVVLVNSDGSTAARLYRTATARYDGSTSSGSAISFSR